MNMASKSIRLEEALAKCRLHDNPNFSAISIQYSVDCSTLSRRYHGKQQSYLESHSESVQCLTLLQEQILIDFINRLTNRSLPPTSQIVKNVAQELSNRSVGKNWVGQFTRCHSDQLHTGYLQSIDNKRLNAENLVLMQMFYNQVGVFKVINGCIRSFLTNLLAL